MQFDFFPSRRLTIYLAKLFVTRTLAVLVMLVLVLQMLDLLSESGKILAYPGNGESQLWTYVSMRAPQLVQRFLPYSVLLATIITLATLNQNSEVIAMKAAGMSAHQVLAPLLVAALAISAASFAFNERIVTHSTAALKAWSAVDYGPVPKDPGQRSNVYLNDGGNILAAAIVRGHGKDTVMEGVTWYRRDERGMIAEQVRAPRAIWTGAGWQLENPVRFDVATTRVSGGGANDAQLIVAPKLGPAEVAVKAVDADTENLFELSNSIAELRAAGHRTAELEGQWWHKISGPLSAVLMPLLGAVAAFGLARSGQLLIRAVTGMALGFAYFVVDNAALAMGSFGGYPPLVAAWAPFLLFALLGETVLIRTEE